MEDALARIKFVINEVVYQSLNPCCNGRCTRTKKEMFFQRDVLDSLNPCCNGRCTRTPKLGLCFV